MPRRLLLVDLDNLLDPLLDGGLPPYPPAARDDRAPEVVVSVALCTVSAERLDDEALVHTLAARLAGRSGQTYALELTLTPARPQAADEALERLLGESPSAAHAGEYAVVELLTGDLGLRQRIARHLGVRHGPPMEGPGRIEWAGGRPWPRRAPQDGVEGPEPLDLPSPPLSLGELGRRFNNLSPLRTQIGLGPRSASGPDRLSRWSAGVEAGVSPAQAHPFRPDGPIDLEGWLPGRVRPSPLDETAVLVGDLDVPLGSALPRPALQGWRFGAEGLPVRLCFSAPYAPGETRHVEPPPLACIDDAALLRALLTEGRGGPPATLRLRPRGGGASLTAEVETPDLWWSAQNAFGRTATDRLRLPEPGLTNGRNIQLHAVLVPHVLDGAPEALFMAPGSPTLKIEIVIEIELAPHQVWPISHKGRDTAILIGAAPLPAGTHAFIPIQALSRAALLAYRGGPSAGRPKESLRGLRRLPLLVPATAKGAPLSEGPGAACLPEPPAHPTPAPSDRLEEHRP